MVLPSESFISSSSFPASRLALKIPNTGGHVPTVMVAPASARAYPDSEKASQYTGFTMNTPQQSIDHHHFYGRKLKRLTLAMAHPYPLESATPATNATCVPRFQAQTYENLIPFEN